MLKICVILWLLTLSTWAASDEAMPSGGTNVTRKMSAKECIALALQNSHAPIVEIVPEMKSDMHWLRSKLAGMLNAKEIAAKDLKALAASIAALEVKVRGVGWTPDVEEHLFTVSHVTVRDAGHDLKNALLTAFIDTEKISDAATDVERRQNLESVEINLEVAGEMIATIENPTTSRKRIFSVRELFRDMEKLLQNLPNNVALTTVRPAVGLAVRASRTDFLRIVQNLVLNAAEVMPNGGEIKLSAEEVVPLKPEEAADEQSYVTEARSEESTLVVRKGTVSGNRAPSFALRVSDNGPGMSKQLVSTSFGPQTSTKEQTESDANPGGVGLSSVLTLVTANNGIMEVNSELGKGTEMTATFPLVSRKMTEQMEQEINVASVPGLIVVVDDIASQRFVASRMLQSAGLPVATFSNALSALEFCRRHKEDIRMVLLDEYLGDGSSMDSNVDDLIAEGITAPIIAAGGSPLNRELRVAGSLIKPWGIDAFLAMLARLENKEPTTPAPPN
jgi:signal transduction histidine kinase